MKNRLITILVVFIFALFIFGCERTDVGNSSNEYNSEVQSYNDNSQLQSSADDISYDSSFAYETSEVSETIEPNTEIKYIKKLYLNGKQKFTNVGMIGDLYIYGIYESSINDKANIKFYSYNLNTDNIIEIGTIKDVNTWTTFAIIPDGLIYFTMGIMMNEDVMNKEVINKHYVMDVNKKTIEIIESDSIYPPLVYSYVVNDFEYIEFQPETIENGYRYNISIGNTDGQLKKIVVKESNSNLKTGESITCVCVYDQKIYTCQNTIINGEIKNYLYTYDLEGNEIDKEDISFINEYFNDPSGPVISRFSVFKNYYFIRSAYDGSSLFLKRTDSGYEKINISEWLTYVNAVQNNFLFVNYESNDFYIFNSDTEQLTVLDLPYNNIQILYAENKLVVYSDEGAYYYTIN